MENLKYLIIATAFTAKKSKIKEQIKIILAAQYFEIVKFHRQAKILQGNMKFKRIILKLTGCNFSLNCLKFWIFSC